VLLFVVDEKEKKNEAQREQNSQEREE